MNKYHEVTAQLEQALSGISYENLDISDEVKEQVKECLDTVFLIVCRCNLGSNLMLFYHIFWLYYFNIA